MISRSRENSGYQRLGGEVKKKEGKGLSIENNLHLERIVFGPLLYRGIFEGSY